MLPQGPEHTDIVITDDPSDQVKPRNLPVITKFDCVNTPLESNFGGLKPQTQETCPKLLLPAGGRTTWSSRRIGLS